MDQEGTAAFDGGPLETHRVYDAASVDEYVAGLESELLAQQAKIADLTRSLDQTARASAEAKERSGNATQSEALLGRALLTAQRTADEITAEAERQAAEIIADAHRQADDAVATARLQAARIVDQARASGDSAVPIDDGAFRGVWAPPSQPPSPQDATAGLVGLPRLDRPTWGHPASGGETFGDDEQSPSSSFVRADEALDRADSVDESINGDSDRR